MSVWDEAFANRPWGRWPSEPVVRAVSRIAPDPSEALKVLEIGCGPGAQLFFLEHEGHWAVGLDRSRVGLQRAQRRMAALGRKQSLVEADIAALPFRGSAFDVVIDVEALAHNHEQLVPAMWGGVARVLAPGGWFVSVGFTAATHGLVAGTAVGGRSFTDVPDGPLQGWGIVSTIGEDDARALAHRAGFEIDEIQRRGWTTGSSHWWVEELVVVARRHPASSIAESLDQQAVERR